MQRLIRFVFGIVLDKADQLWLIIIALAIHINGRILIFGIHNCCNNAAIRHFQRYMRIELHCAAQVIGPRQTEAGLGDLKPCSG